MDELYGGSLKAERVCDCYRKKGGCLERSVYTTGEDIHQDFPIFQKLWTFIVLTHNPPTKLSDSLSSWESTKEGVECRRGEKGQVRRYLYPWHKESNKVCCKSARSADMRRVKGILHRTVRVDFDNIRSNYSSASSLTLKNMHSRDTFSCTNMRMSGPPLGRKTNRRRHSL
jgi:hypothetical protein